MTYLCQDCKSNVVQCLICKGKGNYYGAEYKKNKKDNTKNENHDLSAIVNELKMVKLKT